MEEQGSRVRLAKLLARRGVASRRAAEELIAQQVVTVNGRVVDGVGSLVDPAVDVVRVDGRPLPPEPALAYYVLYKPRGASTNVVDPHGRETIFEPLEKIGIVGLMPIGKLEFNAEGALVLTNDTELIAALNRTGVSIPRRYMAKVYRTPDEADLRAIERGVRFADSVARPAKARVLDTTDSENAWVELTTTEPSSSLPNRLFAQLGHPVSKLRRESFATISIRGLERGGVRPLTGEEIARLRDLAAGVPAGRAGHGPKPKGFAKAKPRKPRHPRNRERTR
jgi:23S rRNA pseudouridine2605 synthase